MLIGTIVVFGLILTSDRLARSIGKALGNLVSRLRVLTNVLIGHLGKMPTCRGALGLFTHQHKADAMRALDRVGQFQC